MVSLRCRLPRATFLVVWCLAALGLGWQPLRAQDRLVFKDGHVQDGKIVGMSGPTVLMTVTTASGAPGQISFNMGLLNRVDAAPPPAYNAGVAAYGVGDWDKALAALKPVTDQFRGLPTTWAQQAAGMLGDIYVEKNDLPRAEAAYGDYRKLYPATSGNSVRSNLGQARIAFARNNVSETKRALEPITTAALKNPADASRSDAAAYGQAFYLRGLIREKDGDAPGALEDYLRTVTLFYQDAATTARARKAADALRAAHKDLVAP